jgi:V-type H+-transporting ATPase subunit a
LGRDLVGGAPGAGGEQEALLPGAVDITHIAGVVAQDDIERLKRLIFRSTKGKSYVRTREYFDAAPISTEKKQPKSSYIIMFWEGKQIRDKIEKICDSFNGQRFVLPPAGQLAAQIGQVDGYIADAKANFDATRANLRDQLAAFNASDGRGELERDEEKVSAIYIYKLFIAKEKAIFRTINMMRLRPGAEQFVGYFWCPVVDRGRVESIAQDSRFANAVEPITPAAGHRIEPPTHIPSTDVTWLSQELVNLYGIPRYQEANPMIVSLVTFPFLFGMMFGDLGHGSLIGMIGVFLIYQGEKGPLAKGRFPLFLMGLFAMWAGATYNEFFALPLNMFNSCYQMTSNTTSG